MDEIEKRRGWFKGYMAHLDSADAARTDADRDEPRCPCCGYRTLGERGAYEICEVCEREDDGQDDPYAEEGWGGPNGNYSLADTRRNFRTHLTMYRKSDRDRFQRETTDERLRQKRKLMDQLGEPR